MSISIDVLDTQGKSLDQGKRVSFLVGKGGLEPPTSASRTQLGYFVPKGGCGSLLLDAYFLSRHDIQ